MGVGCPALDLSLVVSSWDESGPSSKARPSLGVPWKQHCSYHKCFSGNRLQEGIAAQLRPGPGKMDRGRDGQQSLRGQCPGVHEALSVRGPGPLPASLRRTGPHKGGLSGQGRGCTPGWGWCGQS